MAKSKKKKKVQPPIHTGLKPSKNYLDMCYATARKILRAVGEDESLLDIFTKRQKQEMFNIFVSPPYVAAMPGHKVPKAFIQYMQVHLTAALKAIFYDEKNGVRWMDVVTVGHAMMLSFMSDAYTDILQPPQLEVAKRLEAVFGEKNMLFDSYKRMIDMMRISLLFFSQPNFRVYGLAAPQPVASLKQKAIRHILHVTTHECQTLRFNYRNRERTAFRVFIGPIAELPALNATISMSKLFPDIKHDRELNIYIQSHAIHRLKERVDTIDPTVRNHMMLLSLIFTRNIVRGSDARLYMALTMPDESEIGKVLGYFAFTIDGENLLILTFLPLLSERTPEGHLLNERLHLSSEDLKYLGMDKLSFFFDVDIQQIPLLKQVLYDELHLDYIRTLYSTNRPIDGPFNEKRTSFVKNFFQKLEDCSLTEPLTELSDDCQAPAVPEVQPLS